MAAAEAAGVAAAGGGGGPMTITQDATMLKIERQMGGNDVTSTYKLDGSESKNTQMGRGGETEVVSKAMWTGNTIVITTEGQNGYDQGRLLDGRR